MSQKKLQALLNMSVQATDPNSTVSNPPGEMDEERKQWVKEAISKSLEDDESNSCLLYTSPSPRDS